MKILPQAIIAFLVVGCSQEENETEQSESAPPPQRELSGISCPIHYVPVYKIAASTAHAEPVWDPKLELTIEQIRNRFPYAIWDSNLHSVDESDGANFPRYNLVCNRCQDSWGEYAAEQIPLQKEPRLEIHISTSGEVRIGGTQFELDQLTAIAKAASELNSETRAIFRVDNETATEVIRNVVTAVEEGGLHDFIFGSYVPERHSP